MSLAVDIGAARAPEPPEDARLAETRARLVRELHDLVSHAVSQIVVQAGVLQTLAGPEPPVPDSPLELLQRTAREAMQDLRRMGAVVNAGLAAPYGPQPGVAGLAELIEEHRRNGLTIVARLPGTPVDVPSSASLALYRAVEEVLAALDGATADATVAVQPVDGGVVGAIDVRTPQSLGALRAPGALAATRERVQLQRGTMHVMIDAPTTWMLRIFLPTR